MQNKAPNISPSAAIIPASDLGRTLLVMPAFNEEEVIEDVIVKAMAVLPGVDILVVNDGSRDRTAEIASNAGALVLTLPFNLGVGGAMRAGFRYALESGYDNVVQVDADGQHNPGDIPALLSQLSSFRRDGSDIVIGARFAGVGSYESRGPRKWAMSLLAATLSRVVNVKLTDTTSGFRASGPLAVQIFAEHYPAEYLGDTIESLVIAARAGCNISQIPVEMHPRAGGIPSQNGLRSTMHLGRIAISLAMALLRPPVTVMKGDS